MAKPPPKLLTVEQAQYITPHMIRVVLTGDLGHIAPDCAGANCKLFIPNSGESRDAFLGRFARGDALTRRTYTVRYFDPARHQLTIDFVAHGDHGPASAWAMRAKAGDFIGFAGPGALKIAAFEADFYIFGADMSALPVAAAVLDALPKDAKGIAFFEIQTPDDQYPITAPAGIDVNWLIHPDPNHSSDTQINAIKALDWPDGRVQTCIAGENAVIKELRHYLLRERALPRTDCYISGYWKIGMVEDEHQPFKRAELAQESTGGL